MKELKELLKVKSLMTLTVMGVFVYMSVVDKLPSEVTASTITAVITYYFSKKDSNKDSSEDKTGE